MGILGVRYARHSPVSHIATGRENKGKCTNSFFIYLYLHEKKFNLEVFFYFVGVNGGCLNGGLWIFFQHRGTEGTELYRVSQGGWGVNVWI